jgi:hypothetical protein
MPASTEKSAVIKGLLVRTVKAVAQVSIHLRARDIKTTNITHSVSHITQR